MNRLLSRAVLGLAVVVLSGTAVCGPAQASPGPIIRAPLALSRERRPAA